MFNSEGRIHNSIRNSFVAIASQSVNLIMAFVYRLIFLKILDETYLGLNSLFANILGLLSLAELGIGIAISYRLYASMNDKDASRTGALIKFYKNIYYCIAAIVLVVGLAVMPFLKFFIKGYSSLPLDVNIYLLYLIFLIQSVFSYLFSYRLMLFNSDQKNFITNVANIITTFVLYLLQILVLYFTRNYLYTLIVSISVNLISNVLMSIYAKKMYKEIFKSAGKLDSSEKKTIFKETGALLCHRIGGKVVTSTDNILISSFVGIAILGAYSNYSLIITSLIALLGQFLGAIGASIGNLHVADKQREEDVFLKLVFFNLFIVSFCATCFFVLIEPFIGIMFGYDLVLSTDVALICALAFYIGNARLINDSFISGCGLFIRDKFRPLIEAGINLVASIILAQVMGIVGILIGTIIGQLCTVYWREPYLLYKYEFNKSQVNYWKLHLRFLLLTLVIGFICYFICGFIPNSLGFLVCKFLICIIVSLSMLLLFNCKSEYCKYFISLTKNIILRRKK